MSLTKLPYPNIEMPRYRINVRHPKYGWQVVGAFYSKGTALDLYVEWIDRTGDTMSVQLTEMDAEAAQCWAVIKSFIPENEEGTKHGT